MSRDVETAYGTTHVHACGAPSGTPIVLLHGMAVSSPSWFASVAGLGEHHPVFAVDTITDAGRSTQTAAVRDGADLARWLDELLAALKLDRAHLVGLSYGGWIALNQACRSPERLASITSVDPPGAIGRPRVKFMIGMVPDSVLAKAKSDKALHRLLRRMNNGTLPAEDLLDLSVAGFRAFRAKQPFPKRMTDAELRSIQTPALLLIGAHSPVNDSARAVDRAIRLIVNVEAEVIPGAGHMLPVEKPDLFTNRALRFMQNVDARDHASTFTPPVRDQ